MCGLDIACLVGTAGLQDGFLTVPSPWAAESSVAFRKNGLLKLCDLPRAAPIRTDFGFRRATGAAPCQPANLMKAWLNLLLPAPHRLCRRIAHAYSSRLKI